jgi:hypothetical protein
MINNFGKEEISYLDSNYFTNLIMNQHIETAYIQLIKDIYLNKEHPENQTVKVDNINDKYAFIFNEGKWNTILKYELKEILHRKNYTILNMHYDKLKNTMSVPKTFAFLMRDDITDPHMMYEIEKIIILFHTKENINTQYLETKKEICILKKINNDILKKLNEQIKLNDQLYEIIFEMNKENLEKEDKN